MRARASALVRSRSSIFVMAHVTVVCRLAAVSQFRSCVVSRLSQQLWVGAVLSTFARFTFYQPSLSLLNLERDQGRDLPP